MTLYNNVVKINVYEGLMGTVGQGCATAINRQLADLYLKCNINWAHDHLIDCIAVLHNGLYFTKDKLFLYRIHDTNTISMPTGPDNQRKTSLLTRLKETYGCLKWFLFSCSLGECEQQMYDMGDYREVESFVGISEELSCDLKKWRTIRNARLQYIKQKKLISYICLRIREPEYFLNAVSHCTYEQHLLCLLYDIGLIIK